MLREEKNDAEMEAEENIKSLLEHHAKQDQDLEQSFQEKMMEEVNKYQILMCKGARWNIWDQKGYKFYKGHE